MLTLLLLLSWDSLTLVRSRSKTRHSLIDIACCERKCFCMLVVFPPFDEISTLQVLQVALLSSFLVKCNQTFEHLYHLGAMFTVDCWLHWTRHARCVACVSYEMCVMTSFATTGIDKGIVVVNQQAATPFSPASSTEARADAELPISTNADQLNSSTRRLQKHSKTWLQCWVIVNSTGGKSCTRE